MRIKILLIILLFFQLSAVLPQNSENTTIKFPKELKSIVPYGTLENAFVGSKNEWAVIDIIPRIGLKGEWKIDKEYKYYAFMTAEVGLNLARRNDYITFSADPGPGIGKVQQAVFARLGFIGVGTPYGRISFGKQWGVNYRLGGSIDDMYMGGAFGIGVYNAGTDGGVSGTGRADQSVKYEFDYKSFYIGVQSQFRDISTNDKAFSDAFGATTSYDFKPVKIGVSYNKVFDGIDDPQVGEAKTGDEFLSFLIDYKRENFHFGVMTEFFNNHEITDEGDFYCGWGIEYSLRYHFGKDKKWRFVNNSYILKPNDENMKYMVNRYTFNLARRFNDNFAVILGFTIDNSINANGIKPALHQFGVGFYYNFNYPVP